MQNNQELTQREKKIVGDFISKNESDILSQVNKLVHEQTDNMNYQLINDENIHLPDGGLSKEHFINTLMSDLFSQLHQGNRETGDIILFNLRGQLESGQ